jgi:hypothetical protein
VRRLKSRSCDRSILQRALALVLLGPLLCLGCGGGGGEAAVPGTLSLRLVWETDVPVAANGYSLRPFNGSEEVPPSVLTIEVRVTPSGQVPIRAFTDPAVRVVTIDTVPAGNATVQVFGYDVPIEDQQEIVQFGLPPAFQSEPKVVQIAPRQITNAGVFELAAQPFATSFDPPPAATGVPVFAPVFFLIVTAVGDIERSSINVNIAGMPVIVDGQTRAGAILEPCNDDGGQPCSAGADKGLAGFSCVFEAPAGYPANSSILVLMSASASGGLPSFSFNYVFQTGFAFDTPTPTSTPSPTEIPPPTHTATLTDTATVAATATMSPTATPSPTHTATATTLPSATSTPTSTASAVATGTATDTPSPTVTEEATSTATATVSESPSVSPTAAPTDTPSMEPTATRTQTATEAPSATETGVPTETPSPTASSPPTETTTPAVTETATETSTPVETPTPTPSPTVLSEVPALTQFAWLARGQHGEGTSAEAVS